MDLRATPAMEDVEMPVYIYIMLPSRREVSIKIDFYKDTVSSLKQKIVDRGNFVHFLHLFLIILEGIAACMQSLVWQQRKILNHHKLSDLHPRLSTGSRIYLVFQMRSINLFDLPTTPDPLLQSTRRLRRESELLLRDHNSVTISESFREFFVEIEGPEDTLYEGIKTLLFLSDDL